MGYYKLFLKQETQINSLGQTFNNYILDIVKNENFISNTPIPQKNIEEQVNTSPTLSCDVVEKPKEVIIKENTDKKVVTNNQKAEKTKAKKQTKSKNIEESPKETKTNEVKEVNKTDEFENCYCFESLTTENILNKKYNVGRVYDMQDKLHSIVLKEEDAKELEQCDLGTMIKINEMKIVKDREFAINLEFIDKMLKNIAA